MFEEVWSMRTNANANEAKWPDTYSNGKHAFWIVSLEATSISLYDICIPCNNFDCIDSYVIVAELESVPVSYMSTNCSFFT